MLISIKYLECSTSNVFEQEAASLKYPENHRKKKNASPNSFFPYFQ